MADLGVPIEWDEEMNPKLRNALPNANMSIVRQLYVNYNVSAFRYTHIPSLSPQLATLIIMTCHDPCTPTGYAIYMHMGNSRTSTYVKHVHAMMPTLHERDTANDDVHVSTVTHTQTTRVASTRRVLPRIQMVARRNAIHHIHITYHISHITPTLYGRRLHHIHTRAHYIHCKRYFSFPTM